VAAGDFVKEVGSNALNATTATDLDVTVPAGGIAQGNTVILSVGGVEYATGAHDSRGNTYTVYEQQNTANKRSSVVVALIETALLEDDTITAEFASNGNTAMLAVEFEGDCSVLDSSTGTFTTVAAQVIDTPDTAALDNSDDLYYGCVGRDGTAAVTLTHTTTGLTNRTQVNNTGTTRSIHTFHKRLASNAALDYQGSLSVTTRIWGCSVVVLKVAAGGTTFNDTPSGTQTASGSLTESVGETASAVPDGIISSGSWIASTGTLATAIDDPGLLSDSDYIESGDGTASVDICEVSLTNVSAPPPGEGFLIRIKSDKNEAGGDALALTVKLIQGTTVIKTMNYGDPTPLINTWVVNPAERATISDFTDLRLRFEVVKP
jgi:hypothetical protein